MGLDTTTIQPVLPGNFDPVNHYYPRVMNAHLNPLVRHFFSMTLERIALRYCHLNPHVQYDYLLSRLKQPAQHLPWAGCDLMHVTNAFGHRQMVVIETNSSPSGQKSMPLLNEDDEYNGYKKIIEPLVPHLQRSKKKGGLAVLYDKNPMEASGYAATLADMMKETVWLVPFESTILKDERPHAWFENGELFIRVESEVKCIRYAHRYVTQKPWNRIPVRTKTRLQNPIVGCLAGGRNKALAAKAYDWYNAQIAEHGLRINTPTTIWDVHFSEVPRWVEKMGGYAVIKVPYSNAGQGVYTITNTDELEAFKRSEFTYERYVVQSLIGHYNWSSGIDDSEKLFHVGTIPNKRGEIFVADLRMMVCSTMNGWRPVAMYARRAREPITKIAPQNSWSVLGTNLSGKLENGVWTTDSSRLLLMDERDFNRLGLSLDEIIEAFVQTVLSVLSINQLAGTLLNQKKELKRRIFSGLCNDAELLREIRK